MPTGEPQKPAVGNETPVERVKPTVPPETAPVPPELPGVHEVRAMIQAAYEAPPELLEKIDYREQPIVRKMLEHTGKLDGDDTGYRDVPLSPLDKENPDELVDVEEFGLAAFPVYARGALPGLTPYYGNGIGSYEKILLREPVARALQVVDSRLKPYNRQLLILDGMRTTDVQARLWVDIRDRLLGKHAHMELSVLSEIQAGRAADKIGAYCLIVKDAKYDTALNRLKNGPLWNEMVTAAETLKTTPDDVAHEYLTYMGNRRTIDLTLDETASTSHGGGGAVDVWLVDSTTGKPVNLGVPFDYVGRSGVIDYFEWATLEEYQTEVANSPDLQQYLQECGVENVHRIDRNTFNQIRQERRLMFNSMMSVGATFYSLGKEEGEPWHFNIGNEMGGKQADMLYGAGSSCHSLLKNFRDPKTGELIAIWTNESAHRLAREKMRKGGV